MKIIKFGDSQENYRVLTVSNLIKELQHIQSNIEVWRGDTEYGEMPIGNVRVHEGKIILDIFATD